MNIKYIKKQLLKAFKKCDEDNGYYLPLENLYYKWVKEQSIAPSEQRGELLAELQIYLEDKNG